MLSVSIHIDGAQLANRCLKIANWAWDGRKHDV